MKKLIKSDNRVLVQDNEEKTPWDKKPVMCTCPNCGAEVPYRVFSRQVQARVLYDRHVIVDMLKELGHATKGEFVKKYRETSGNKVTDRHLGNILHQLEAMGVIKLTIRNLGRYGRTTDITFIKDVPKNVEKSFFLDGRSLRQWETEKDGATSHTVPV